MTSSSGGCLLPVPLPGWNPQVYFNQMERDLIVSIIPRSSGRLLVWDVTYSNTLPTPNFSVVVTEAGAVELQAEK